MPGVLVIGEVSDGHLLPASLEAATAGAALAQALGEPLLGALLGDALNNAAATFAAGFATLYLAEHATLQRYTAHATLHARQLWRGGRLQRSAARVCGAREAASRIKINHKYFVTPQVRSQRTSSLHLR